MIKNNLNKWGNFIVPLKNKTNLFLKDIIISDALNIFWTDVVNKIVSKNPFNFLILFRVQYKDGTFATIGKMNKINNNMIRSVVMLSYIDSCFKSLFSDVRKIISNIRNLV